LDSNSSLTKCVSLNSSIACSFSLLSCDVSSISNACLRIVSNVQRHTWYCSGNCSVTYSRMHSLACLRRYAISELIEAFDTCSSCAISIIIIRRVEVSFFMYSLPCLVTFAVSVFCFRFQSDSAKYLVYALSQKYVLLLHHFCSSEQCHRRHICHCSWDHACV
jgi:hypothetical protein